MLSNQIKSLDTLLIESNLSLIIFFMVSSILFLFLKGGLQVHIIQFLDFSRVV